MPPLAAPGQTAWINLLKGRSLLILLNELPPYLENAKAKQIGNTDLSVVTTTALANLFTALTKPELSNVCLVISDLRATYESGSELLQSSFRELENEVNRSALNIEPVGSSSDEIFHILKIVYLKAFRMPPLIKNPFSTPINQVTLIFRPTRFLSALKTHVRFILR